MPITVQLPAGLVSQEDEQKIVVGLSETLLDLNGASKNTFVRKNLIVDVEIRDPDCLFADSVRVQWVNVTLRIPPMSLSTLEQQREFVTRLTNIITEVTGDKLPKDRVYINLIRGDEFWGIGGVTYSNEELGVHAAKFGDGQAVD